VASAGLTNRSTSNSETTLSMFDVTNEFAEHDRRNRNITVYNLSEQAN